ncbi:hypothetical protein QZH41_017422 [Actinostola sp. cb2023]|nr:hypothetical protein QZH41_017422 [Actinostola sp. cb2023]
MEAKLLKNLWSTRDLISTAFTNVPERKGKESEGKNCVEWEVRYLYQFHKPTKNILNDMLKLKIQRGEYTVGELVVPRKYEKLVIDKEEGKHC